jgi:hypothetical protein
MKSVTAIGSVVFAVAVTASACGSSTPKASSNTVPSSTAAPPAPQSNAPSSAPASSDTGGATKALPPPCTLLTATDVNAFFGGVPLDFMAVASVSPGQSECVIERKVGTTARMISVTDRVNFGDDASYVFPNLNTTAVTTLGYPAVLEHPSEGESRITVKLGKNALAISVDFYTDPVNDALATQLTKAALARL